jgi:hypothetical protein
MGDTGACTCTSSIKKAFFMYSTRILKWFTIHFNSIFLLISHWELYEVKMICSLTAPLPSSRFPTPSDLLAPPPGRAYAACPQPVPPTITAKLVPTPAPGASPGNCHWPCRLSSYSLRSLTLLQDNFPFSHPSAYPPIQGWNCTGSRFQSW